jgi:hypothetical protein
MAKKKEEKEEGKQKRIITGTRFFVFFRLSNFFYLRNIGPLNTFGSAVQIHLFFSFVKIPPTYSRCKIKKKEHTRTYQKAIRRRINKESKP